jgi:hypothetical protein
MKKIQMKEIIEIFIIFLIFFSSSIAQKERVGYWDKEKKRYILNKNYFSDTEQYNFLKKYVNEGLIHFNRDILIKILEQDFINFDILLKIARDNTIEFEDFHDKLYMEEFLIQETMCDLEHYYWDFLEYYYKKYAFADKEILKVFKNGPYIPDKPPYCFEPNIMRRKGYEFLLVFRHLLNKYVEILKDPKKFSFDNDLLDEIIYYSMSDLKSGAILDILQIKPGDNNWQDWYKKEAESTIDLPNRQILIKVSSQLSSKYSKKNLLDYNLFTAWVEGNENSGEGEWIELEFPGQISIGKVILFPGYGKSLKLFKANARLKKIKVSWNNKEKIVNFLDKYCAQSIDIFDKTDKIRIEVVEVYEGYKYKDLCISEIMVTTK